jgi:hypothetical protein
MASKPGINEWAIVVACGAAPAVVAQVLKRVRPHL